jgi:hypothetical protein
MFKPLKYERYGSTCTGTLERLPVRIQDPLHTRTELFSSSRVAVNTLALPDLKNSSAYCSKIFFPKNSFDEDKLV